MTLICGWGRTVGALDRCMCGAEVVHRPLKRTGLLWTALLTKCVSFNGSRKTLPNKLLFQAVGVPAAGLKGKTHRQAVGGPAAGLKERTRRQAVGAPSAGPSYL
eukprot:748778-Pelagomonas_calceolata.AAC.1